MSWGDVRTSLAMGVRGSIRGCRWARSVRSFAFLLCLGPLFCVQGATAEQGAAAASLPAGEEKVIRMGYTEGLFQNMNKADALAAMTVWAQTVAAQYDVKIAREMDLYHSVKEVRAALLAEEWDCMSLLLPEYIELGASLLRPPYVTYVKDGCNFIEYVLLCPATVNGIAELAGKEVTIHTDADTCMAVDWLNFIFVEQGAGSLAEADVRLEYNRKPSGTVLGVFFGKSDACVVTRSVFESMVELNPQVGKKLKIMAVSEHMIRSIFGFRNEFVHSQEEQMLTAVVNLQSSKTGEQLLRVFKISQMAYLDERQVRESIAIYQKWRQTGLPENAAHAPRQPGDPAE